MTRIGQSVHVMLKDVRQARLPLLTYLVVVIASVLRIVATPLPSQAFVVAAPLLVLLGIIVIASVVQNDSPARANEFWTSRPFHPSAIVGSKLLFGAIALIGAGLVGELIALRLFDVTAAETSRLMFDSILTYGCYLFGAVVLAALTQDIRAFVVAALLIGIGSAAVYAAMPRRLGLVVFQSSFSRPMFWIVAIVGGLALLSFLYRTLEVRRTTWAAAAVVVASIIALSFGAGAVAFPREAVASASPAVTLSVQQPIITASGHRLRVQISAVGGDSSQRIAFDPDSATVHFRDGSTARGRNYGAFALIRAGNPGLASGVRLLESPTDRIYTNVDFNIAESVVPTQQIDYVEMTGRVWVSEAEQVASVSLRSGERAARNGIRARVSKVQFAPGWSTFEIQTAEIPSAMSFSPSYASGLNVVAVNDSRREAIVAHSSQTSGSSEWAVLPGAPVNTSVATYTALTRDTSGEVIPRDSAWYKTARVSIVRWKPRASYIARLSTQR